MLAEGFQPPSATAPEAEHHAPTSPFAESFEFTTGSAFAAEAEWESSAANSPFRNEYEETAPGDGGASPQRQAYLEMVAELYNEEFSEALYELAAEVSAAAQIQYTESEGVSTAENTQLAEQYLAPLAQETESLFTRISEQYAQHDISQLSEAEIDRIFESLQPEFGHLSPAFEGFLGKIWRKAKDVAKVGVRLAAKGVAAVGKLGLGWVFDKLKRLGMLVLRQVLQYAMGQVPAHLQASARQVANRLFGSREAEAGSWSGESWAAADAPVTENWAAESWTSESWAAENWAGEAWTPASEAWAESEGRPEEPGRVAESWVTENWGTESWAAEGPATEYWTGGSGLGGQPAPTDRFALLPADAPLQSLAHPDLDSVQQGFDAQAAALLFAPEGAAGEQQGTASETWAAGAETSLAEDPLGRLDAAREQFAAEAARAVHGQDLTPQLEQFIPAVLAALRLGVGLIGRPRVTAVMGRAIAGLLRKIPGLGLSPQLAGALGTAVASAGLGMVGLEGAEERRLLLGEAVAGVVEGTVRRVMEQGGEVLADQRLLEAAVQEAFAEAAAESFPPSALREDLHEVSGRVPLPAKGTWVRYPRQRCNRYKRYSRALPIRLTPQNAAGLTAFGGVPLAAFLQARYGLRLPASFQGHLFESLPGTRLSAVALASPDIRGMGPSQPRGYRLFVPATRELMGRLVGEAGLGRDVPAEFLRSHRRITVGQRFLVLVPQTAAPGRAPLHPPGPKPSRGQGPGPGRAKDPDGPRPESHPSQINLTLDFPGERAVAYIHLGEQDTQQIAASLRAGESATPALLLLRSVYVAGLRSMLSGDARRHVKLVHESVAESEAEGGGTGLLAGIGESILKKLADKLVDWIGKALAEYLARSAKQFQEAAAKRTDGVTITVVIRHPSLMQVLRRLLRGDRVAAAIEFTKVLLAPAVVASVSRIDAGFRS
ncbi:hypothetical protein [Kitasatospora sp. NPDC004289]